MRRPSGQPRIPIIERAYQLAATGSFSSTREVCLGLYQEGYRNISPYFEGAAIRASIQKKCDSARGIERERAPGSGNKPKKPTPHDTEDDQII
jgi:hypothetical protein